MNRRVATVFGGSGFIGRQVVRRLAAEGWTVRVAVRDPIAAGMVKPMGEPGQVLPMRADITDPASLPTVVADASLVVNMVGILAESSKARFETVHCKGAANVARAALDAGVTRLLHTSALGADKDSVSEYARTKAKGEEEVRSLFPNVTIFRPSVVFGPDDNFFNRFAKLARVSPVLPVYTLDGFKFKCAGGVCSVDTFGSGGPRFQLVYVGDVAEAFAKAVDDPSTAGKTYELGGPRVCSWKDVLDLVMQTTERNRLLVPLPLFMAKIHSLFLQYLPNPPLTPDQVNLMKVDNVLHEGALGLQDLGITPTAAEAIVPTYLHRYRE